MSVIELKPCPFCGHVGASKHEGSTFRWRYLECDNCGARCGETRINTLNNDQRQAELDVYADLVHEWNTRTEGKP